MKIQRFLILSGLFFLLNLLWEFLHYPLYNDFSGMEKLPRLAVASFFDMLILSSIFLVISIKNRNLRWVKKPSKIDYILIIFLGVIIAAYIEITNVAKGGWAYKSAMPQIFSIGLGPLIQLFSTAIISIKIFNCLKNK